jgi:hypothetical protein
MHRLGRRFFVAFYRVLLRERTTVILVADAGADGLVGLVSATLESKRQLAAIRRGRLMLLLATLPALIRTPSLLREVLVRERSLSGARREVRRLLWSADRLLGLVAGIPFPRALHLAHQGGPAAPGAPGCEQGEPRDRSLEQKVEVTPRFLGARAVKVLTTRDGKERTLLEYVLSPKVSQHAT